MLCFFGDGDIDSNAHAIAPRRWLGAFVLSASKRVIFFPGFDFTPTWAIVSGTQSPDKRYDLQIDHISLEKDLRTWHLTSQQSTGHAGRGQTIDLGEGRFLWFGMSLADTHVLREVKQGTVVSARVPSSDSQRRAESFMSSRDGAVFNCVWLHPDARKHFTTGFLHFSFIVGPKGFPNYRGPNFGIPIGSPFLRQPLPELQQVPVRRHRLSFGKELDIQIVTMWLPGVLTTPVTLTAPWTYGESV